MMDSADYSIGGQALEDTQGWLVLGTERILAESDPKVRYEFWLDAQRHSVEKDAPRRAVPLRDVPRLPRATASRAAADRDHLPEDFLLLGDSPASRGGSARLAEVAWGHHPELST